MTPTPRARTLDEMDEEEFRLLVSDAAKGRLDFRESQLLRAPRYEQRVYNALGQMIASVDSQLAERKVNALSTEGEHKWRRGVTWFKRCLVEWRTEIAPRVKAQNRNEHVERVQAESQRYRNLLVDVVSFLSDDGNFVYASWPERFALKEKIEHEADIDLSFYDTGGES